MKDSLYIKTRLDNLKCTIIPQSIQYTMPHHERIQIVSWIYNNGNLQTEHCVKLKLTGCREELIALQFAGESGLQTACVNAKIEELENILN